MTRIKWVWLYSTFPFSSLITREVSHFIRVWNALYFSWFLFSSCTMNASPRTWIRPLPTTHMPSSHPLPATPALTSQPPKDTVFLLCKFQCLQPRRPLCASLATAGAPVSFRESDHRENPLFHHLHLCSLLSPPPMPSTTPPPRGGGGPALKATTRHSTETPISMHPGKGD